MEEINQEIGLTQMLRGISDSPDVGEEAEREKLDEHAVEVGH